MITSAGINGATRSVIDLAREQQSDGWDSLVLLAREGYATEACARVGVPTMLLPELLAVENKDASRHRLIRETAAQCAQRLGGLSIDLIHTHLPSAGLRTATQIGERLRIPVVQTHHSIRVAPADVETALQSQLQFIAVAECASKLLVEHGIEKDRVHYIPNGISQPSRSVHFFDPSGRPHLVFVARLVPDKGLDSALGAMKILEDRLGDAAPDLHVFGDGPDRERCESRALRDGLTESVMFHGTVPDVLGPGLDALALLAPSRREACPLNVLEAMASGIPVITVGVGDVVNMIADRVNGRLVPPDDSCAIAYSVIELLADSRMRSRYARKAREIYSRSHSLKVMADRTAELYSDILRAFADRPVSK
ncbi:glycosyltransferase family 4 protein [Streptomyces sp. NPDC006552]|uniref:glycosyltransferase family 4 protein n=1 Tax=Streptomyces sp. NPDC006552 TaxID=3157179 RepID=UPI0033BCADE9